MDWFRWHHGTVTDPKFRYISSKTSQPVANVLAIWSCVLERASEDFGRCNGLDFDCLDVHLGIEEGASLLIYRAMQVKGMISDDDQVINWYKRQPKYEDPTATDRKRAERERKKAQQSQDVTECHGMSQNVTTEEKRREEKNLKPIADDVAGDAPASPSRRKKQKPTSQHAWFSRWWCWSSQQITGGAYLYAKKDAGALATMLQRTGFEETLERAAAYLTMPEEQRFPRGSPTITGLVGMFNQLAGRSDGVDKLIRSGLLPKDGNIAAFTPWEGPAP